MALPTADLAPTGRACCQLCAQPITKGSIRVAVPMDYRDLSVAGGFLHPACTKDWAARPLGNGATWPAGLDDLLERIAENTKLPDLPPELKPTLEAGVAPPFERLSSKEVADIAKALRRITYGLEAEPILEKAGCDRARLAWHLA